MSRHGECIDMDGIDKKWSFQTVAGQLSVHLQSPIT